MHCYRDGLILIVSAVCAFLAHTQALKVAERACASETGRHSLAHEDVLDRLNTRKIVFVGDCVSRYQYLELAYYVIYGICPDENDPQYLLSERSFNGDWHAFYAASSEQLNLIEASGDFAADETCFCARVDNSPGNIMEERAFRYEDAQGRSFSLHYVQYFQEDYRPLTVALFAARSLEPTHVLVNIGVWQDAAPAGCADWDEGRSSAAAKTGKEDDIGLEHAAFVPGHAASVAQKSDHRCPSMAALCRAFESAAHHENGFELWWNTAVPMVQDGKVVEIISDGHHLNAATQCKLTADQIVDRRGALDDIQPDRAKQAALWWRTDNDQPHVDAEANHAFNSALLLRLHPAPPTGPFAHHWASTRARVISRTKSDLRPRKGGLRKASRPGGAKPAFIEE